MQTINEKQNTFVRGPTGGRSEPQFHFHDEVDLRWLSTPPAIFAMSRLPWSTTATSDTMSQPRHGTTRSEHTHTHIPICMFRVKRRRNGNVAG